VIAGQQKLSSQAERIVAHEMEINSTALQPLNKVWQKTLLLK
jgi:hypothetical protein